MWDAKRILNNGIDLWQGRPDTDFGRGFYVTEKRFQAWDWAVKRGGAYPAVIKFENNLVGLKILDLSCAKDLSKWKSVVFSNRVLRSINREWMDPCTEYDCVIGPMADGHTDEVAKEAIANKWSEEKFFSELGRITKGQQVAIKTRAGVVALGKGKLDHK